MDIASWSVLKSSVQREIGRPTNIPRHLTLPVRCIYLCIPVYAVDYTLYITWRCFNCCEQTSECSYVYWHLSYMFFCFYRMKLCHVKYFFLFYCRNSCYCYDMYCSLCCNFMNVILLTFYFLLNKKIVGLSWEAFLAWKRSKSYDQIRWYTYIQFGKNPRNQLLTTHVGVLQLLVKGVGCGSSVVAIVNYSVEVAFQGWVDPVYFLIWKVVIWCGFDLTLSWFDLSFEHCSQISVLWAGWSRTQCSTTFTNSHMPITISTIKTERTDNSGTTMV